MQINPGNEDGFDREYSDEYNLDVAQDMLKIKRQRVRKEQYQSGISQSRLHEQSRGDNISKEKNRMSGSRNSQGSDGISEHSTKTRRQRQQNTPAELENLRRQNKNKKFHIKKSGNSKFRLFLRRVLICLILYLIFLPGSFLWFKSTLAAKNTPETEDFVYQLGSDEDIYSKKYLKWDKVRVNGTMYLNMTEIAKYCLMTVTGDSEQLRFITRDQSGEHVSFAIGSEIAYVNNVTVRMTDISFVSDGNLYVPMDFVSGYMLGINVSFNKDKNKITISDDPDSDTVSFSLKDPVATESINWDSIGYEIRDQILRSIAAVQSPAAGEIPPTGGATGTAADTGTTAAGATTGASGVETAVSGETTENAAANDVAGQ